VPPSPQWPVYPFAGESWPGGVRSAAAPAGAAQGLGGGPV